MELWTHGKTKRIPSRLIENLTRRLAVLDSAKNIPKDLEIFPGWRIHKLSGVYKDHWSIRVTANFRIVFEWDGMDVYNIDFVDYH